MNIITHSLLPVTARQLSELRSPEPSSYRDQIRGWLLIAVFGSLPDLLDPHISLGARCNSYSHMWPCTLIVVSGCLAGALVFRKRRWGHLLLWCAPAYALHVAGDIVSGGLDFLGTGRALGDWWIPPEAWPAFDLVFITTFILIHRRVRRRHGLEPSIVRAFGERLSKRQAGPP
ncbi:MAG: hypothetical protein HN742_25525 [Lentisphaerae bacterium]|jgi:hypothetical protein|nr:hypothetical protein [Lentisphaerota bacterium]MBT4821045.1 hypothetical protein [Lentisphaerota bacterium]MBT5612282.1 hypothetical protein [Lentisphaerota bacterium]MBT7060740.1 hypothetical protein [Lentisphaerota bacterium]MBT7845261.1 hypothetical protein [Lentisphaerota bacterium]